MEDSRRQGWQHGLFSCTCETRSTRCAPKPRTYSVQGSPVIALTHPSLMDGRACVCVMALPQVCQLGFGNRTTGGLAVLCYQLAATVGWWAGSLSTTKTFDYSWVSSARKPTGTLGRGSIYCRAVLCCCPPSGVTIVCLLEWSWHLPHTPEVP
jgi:hypothetical protein